MGIKMKSNLIFRMTGPQSIERLEPLLPKIVETVNWMPAVDLEAPIDFVWETACEKVWEERHKSALVLNRLHNVAIIEDKANLAFLQLRMSVPTLRTFVAGNREKVSQWLWANYRRLSETSNDLGIDWWAVKAAKGNGGKDVWIINSSNFTEVLAEMPENDEFVIQKYVHNPLLWMGTKKFHFRCYAVLTARMAALVYEMAYILTASIDYNCSSMEMQKHITNLSVNKRTPGHPGQIPCHLPTEYPEVFRKIGDMWSSLATACEPFMKHQRSPHHFEFFGVDVISDTGGDCWLIEANRLPGLESSDCNKAAEDAMYDQMMLSLLRVVTTPLLETTGRDMSHEPAVACPHLAPRLSATIDHDDTVLAPLPPAPIHHSISSSVATPAAIKLEVEVEGGATNEVASSLTLHPIEYEATISSIQGPISASNMWVQVKAASADSDCSPEAPTWANLFAWRAFTKKNADAIVVR